MEIKFLRPALIVGNHKMNLTTNQAVELAGKIRTGVFDNDLHKQTKVRMGMAVSPISLIPVIDALHNYREQYMKTNPILIGGQGFYAENGKVLGAFTGETSIEQLTSAGYNRADFTLLGHSETRDIPNYGVKGLGLDDKMINERLLAALTHLNGHEDAKYLRNFFVILCVGETLGQNEVGKTTEVLKRQIETDLDQVPASDMGSGRVVIAYEPVWAIGTGKTASAAQANDACAFIRKTIADQYGFDTAAKLLIQYGGSMGPKNVKELMAQPDIDGGLIGGASLKAEDFLSLLTQTYEVYNG